MASCAEGESVEASQEEALLDYLNAYQEFLTTRVEMNSLLKKAYFQLLKAKNAIKANQIGADLSRAYFPNRITPLATIQTDTNQKLRLSRTLPHQPSLMQQNDGNIPSEMAEPTEDADEDEEEQNDAYLKKIGVGDGLRSEIVGAISFKPERLGVIVGNKLVIERAGESASLASHTLTSSISAASCSTDLLDAQFRGLMEQNTDESEKNEFAHRAKFVASDGGAGDPLRWFSALPPPALREAQKSFMLSLEYSASLVELDRRMKSALMRFHAS